MFGVGNKDWQQKLMAEGARWDLVIVDEAHKMAAHYFANELKTTARYDLGKLIGSVDRTVVRPSNGGSHKRASSRRGAAKGPSRRSLTIRAAAKRRNEHR